MKSLTYFTIASIMFLFTACGPSFNEDYGYYEEGYYDNAYMENGYPQNGYEEGNAPQTQRVSYNGGGGGKLVQHKVVDPKTGMVTSYMPLPTTWKITNKGMTGPEGTTAGTAPGGALPQGRNFHIDEVINNQIAQLIRQYNAQKLNVIDLPQIAQCDQKLMAQYWSAMPDQKTHQAKGVEVKNTNGRLGLIVVHL
ncbi:MAG: hypothetical protein KDC44_25300, partial [Phaeodactylibacter sp.]|nr:hypothetical protein [Phaeodactylibacter sp.]